MNVHVKWSDGVENLAASEDLRAVGQNWSSRKPKIQKGERVKMWYLNKWFYGDIIAVYDRETNEIKNNRKKGEAIQSKQNRKTKTSNTVSKQLNGPKETNELSNVMKGDNSPPGIMSEHSDFTIQMEEDSSEHFNRSQDPDKTPESTEAAFNHEDSFSEGSFNIVVSEPFTLSADYDFNESDTEDEKDKFVDEIAKDQTENKDKSEQIMHSGKVKKHDTSKDLTSLIKPCSVIVTNLAVEKTTKLFQDKVNVKRRGRPRKHKCNLKLTTYNTQKVLDESQKVLEKPQKVLKKPQKVLGKSQKVLEKPPRRILIRHELPTFTKKKDKGMSCSDVIVTNGNQEIEVEMKKQETRGKVVTPKEVINKTFLKWINEKLLKSQQKNSEGEIKLQNKNPSKEQLIENQTSKDQPIENQTSKEETVEDQTEKQKQVGSVVGHCHRDCKRIGQCASNENIIEKTLLKLKGKHGLIIEEIVSEVHQVKEDTVSFTTANPPSTIKSGPVFNTVLEKSSTAQTNIKTPMKKPSPNPSAIINIDDDEPHDDSLYSSSDQNLERVKPYSVPLMSKSVATKDSPSKKNNFATPNNSVSFTATVNSDSDSRNMQSSIKNLFKEPSESSISDNLANKPFLVKKHEQLILPKQTSPMKIVTSKQQSVFKNDSNTISLKQSSLANVTSPQPSMVTQNIMIPQPMWVDLTTNRIIPPPSLNTGSSAVLLSQPLPNKDSTMPLPKTLVVKDINSELLQQPSGVIVGTNTNVPPQSSGIIVDTSLLPSPSLPLTVYNSQNKVMTESAPNNYYYSSLFVINGQHYVPAHSFPSSTITMAMSNSSNSSVNTSMMVQSRLPVATLPERKHNHKSDNRKITDMCNPIPPAHSTYKRSKTATEVIHTLDNKTPKEQQGLTVTNSQFMSSSNSSIESNPHKRKYTNIAQSVSQNLVDGFDHVLKSAASTECTIEQPHSAKQRKLSIPIKIETPNEHADHNNIVSSASTVQSNSSVNQLNYPKRCRTFTNNNQTTVNKLDSSKGISNVQIVKCLMLDSQKGNPSYATNNETLYDIEKVYVTPEFVDKPLHPPKKKDKEYEDLQECLDGVAPFIREVFKCDNIRGGFNNRDLIFVLSLLPDMEEMTNTQKVFFQLKTVEILNEVFNNSKL